MHACRSVERGAREILLWRTSVAVRCASSCFNGHTRVYQPRGPLILCVSGSIGSSYQEINSINAPSVSSGRPWLPLPSHPLPHVHTPVVYLADSFRHIVATFLISFLFRSWMCRLSFVWNTHRCTQTPLAWGECCFSSPASRACITCMQLKLSPSPLDENN